jgi:hypothetical protein
MKIRTKILIIDLMLFLALICIIFISVDTHETAITLPTEGTDSFSLNLRKMWVYQFEVVGWSGDETINLSINQGAVTIFSALLEGGTLKYDDDPESFNYPLLGGPFQVEVTGNYTLIAQVIVEPTLRSTQLLLIGTNQYVLGFDAAPLILIVILVLIVGFMVLFGSTLFDFFYTLRKGLQKRGSEFPLKEDLHTFPVEEPLDLFDREESNLTKIFYNIEKSGFTEETYRICYSDNRDFIIAQRSALNRLGLYVFFGFAFIVIILLGINFVFVESPDFTETFINYLITGITQLLLILGLMTIINKFVDVRRITVYNQDESLVGTIKGNLFFTRWYISESSTVNNAFVRFGLFRSTGEMKTSFGSFSLDKTNETIDVKDVNGELCFSLCSLDSIYKRRRFRIDSNAQLNPVLICMSSICIIERMFRPKTKPD